MGNRPNLDHLARMLRENHRLKQNIDYCWLYKYDELHILCHAVYKDVILEMARKQQVPVKTIQTFS